MGNIEDYRETPKGKEKRQQYSKKKDICPVCKKDFTEERFLNKNLGLCWKCYASLNSWVINRCLEYKYTKIQTGLVLAITLQIAN